jgi:hypothetical protein
MHPPLGSLSSFTQRGCIGGQYINFEIEKEYRTEYTQRHGVEDKDMVLSKNFKYDSLGKTSGFFRRSVDLLALNHRVDNHNALLLPETTSYAGCDAGARHGTILVPFLPQAEQSGPCF